MLKIIYKAEIIYVKCQIKAENTYIVPIYKYIRLGLGIYSPYICIYRNLEACIQSAANLNIYIYTHTRIWVQKAKSSMGNSIELKEAIVYNFQLTYIIINFVFMGKSMYIWLHLALCTHVYCKGCSGCVAHSTAYNNALHSTAPICAATQCHNRYNTYTQRCASNTWGTTCL